MDLNAIDQLAREAGIAGPDSKNPFLRRFAFLVAARERQACAQLCDEIAQQMFKDNMLWEYNGAKSCANEIREYDPYVS